MLKIAEISWDNLRWAAGKIR